MFAASHKAALLPVLWYNMYNNIERHTKGRAWCGLFIVTLDGWFVGAHTSRKAHTGPCNFFCIFLYQQRRSIDEQKEGGLMRGRGGDRLAVQEADGGRSCFATLVAHGNTFLINVDSWLCASVFPHLFESMSFYYYWHIYTGWLPPYE